MFVFFHGYLPEIWAGQVKTGLVGDNDGIRFIQSPMLDDSKKFNHLAKKGGELFSILSEEKRPFYIDRIQGGDYIDAYPYDTNLLTEYQSLLGDKFYGFQMHEWVSNYRTDIRRKLKYVFTWDKEHIVKKIMKKYPSEHGYLFLESMTPEEMEEKGKPKTVDAFLENIFDIYKKRRKVGEILPCDSSILAYNFELMSGSTKIMAEVGAQTPNARVQICYARGMTRKEGRSFGIYYEPWGGVPFGACCYHIEQKNEWNLGADSDFPFRTYGENGGSSRSLQKRLLLYGYLNGAHFMSEEWGVCNTFYDWKTFDLSPYGLVKKEFLRFVEKYPDIGEKLAPIGAVLPKDLYVLDDIDNERIFCGYRYRSDKIVKAKRGVRAIFAQSNTMLGTEKTTLKNSSVPDAVDLINDDDALTKNYDYLVDLTSEESFSKKHPNLCTIEDLVPLLKNLLPCYVEGGHFVINRCTTGGYFLSVFNHSGVERTVEKGENLLPKATVNLPVFFQKTVSPVRLEGEGTLHKDGDKYFVTVPAGGWVFIKF